MRGDWEAGKGEVSRAVEGMRRGGGGGKVRDVKVDEVGPPPPPKRPEWRRVGEGGRGIDDGGSDGQIARVFDWDDEGVKIREHRAAEWDSDDEAEASDARATEYTVGRSGVRGVWGYKGDKVVVAAVRAGLFYLEVLHYGPLPPGSVGSGAVKSRLVSGAGPGADVTVSKGRGVAVVRDGRNGWVWDLEGEEDSEDEDEDDASL